LYKDEAKVMKVVDRIQAKNLMDRLGAASEPFLFSISYDMTKNFVIPGDKVDENILLFDFEGVTNIRDITIAVKPDLFRKFPIAKNDYMIAFDKVQSEIHAGNTYLANLTFQTKIKTDLDLKEIFFAANAPYKLFLSGRFVVFSPETFVKINDGMISSYPMKGTINASIPDAERLILADAKETAEHNTIVDLIRNDLSTITKNVYVKRFRYIDRIKTNNKDLLQVSSEITGELEEGYQKRLGEIMFTLLPAGSVTGAPKRKTVEIINSVEGYDRGFYTGVCGYFDGKDLNSAVMIRFIEQDNAGNLWYKSGGGITAFSEAEKEYQELIDKVYVPLA
jgi:para-aminobenzoate synthetase component I